MKKKLVVLIALMLIISMVFVTGCSKKEEPAPQPAPEEEAEAEPEAESEEEAAPGEETEQEESEETEEPAEEGAQEETVVPAELLGKTEDNSYVNEYFGFRFDAADNWYVLTASERAELMGLAAAEINDEDIATLLESAGYVTDFYALDTSGSTVNGFNNVNVTIQDMGKLYGLITSEKKIAEASVDSIKQALAAQGMETIDVEVGETEFIGKNCVSMTIVSKAGDMQMFQKQIFLKNGSAMACVTATALEEDKTDELLAAFKAN
ncbi:MAG: hypothetical protein IJS33_00670 [Firmicutes bacterium]|nr:hypothetical protein [Bacillota bacterium]